MRPRFLLSLIVAIALALVVIVTYVENQQIMQQEVWVMGAWKVRIVYAILGAFLVGVLLVVPAWIFRDSQRAIQAWRENRTWKERSAIEEIYQSGLEEVLHGRRLDALNLFREVLQRDPYHAGALVEAGNILRTQGETAEAIEMHRRAATRDERNLRALYALAEDHVQAGDREAARAALRKIIERNPRQSLTAYEMLRDLCIEEEDWRGALEVQEKLEHVPILSPHRRQQRERVRTGILYQLGVREREQGRPKETVAMLRKVLKRDPDFSPAYLELGQAYGELGKEEEALWSWKEGYRRTGSPVFLTTMENWFLESGNPRRAIQVFRDLAQSSDSDIVPRFFLGRLFARLEMVEEAYHEFNELKGRAGDSPTLNYYLAKTLERMGRASDSCALYRKVIQDTEVLHLQYGCATCGRTSGHWRPFCEGCHSWNSYQVRLRENLAPESLGINARPVYPVENPADTWGA